MQIGTKKVVTIDYTLTDDHGEVLDSSEGQEPLSYIHGAGNIIPGLERALEGRSTGDELRITVAPGDGYGERDEDLVQAIPRDRFPDESIEVGTRFHARGGGESRMVTVVSVTEQQVTVDANHPLAGVRLTFDVTVREVREATADELKHGHVHGAGGHHHH